MVFYFNMGATIHKLLFIVYSFKCLEDEVNTNHAIIHNESLALYKRTIDLSLDVTLFFKTDLRDHYAFCRISSVLVHYTIQKLSSVLFYCKPSHLISFMSETEKAARGSFFLHKKTRLTSAPN